MLSLESKKAYTLLLNQLRPSHLKMSYLNLKTAQLIVSLFEVIRIPRTFSFLLSNCALKDLKCLIKRNERKELVCQDCN